MEKYKQITQEYQTKKGLLRVVDTLELIEGKYYNEDTFISLNNTQLLIPDYWSAYSHSNLLKKICVVINEKREDLVYLGGY